MCHLGEDFLVRLPRRAASADLLLNEQRWLPELAKRLPLRIPVPLRVGRPGFGFPWAWSIVARLPGRNAVECPPDDLYQAADDLGAFLGARHVPAAADAPENAACGVPLDERDTVVRTRLAELGRLSGAPAHDKPSQIWTEAVAQPAWDGPPMWVHGDLHPANILVDDAHLSAVIDFGDLTAGDPATDLAVAWMLFPAECHDAMRRSYQRHKARPIDDASWGRARGWALSLAVIFLLNPSDDGLMGRIARATLARLGK